MINIKAYVIREISEPVIFLFIICSMRGSLVWTHKNKSFSKRERFRCFVPVSASKDNPVSRRHDVADGINIYKASVTNSGYPFLRVTKINQNSIITYSSSIFFFCELEIKLEFVELNCFNTCYRNVKM
jgi:hypothetical protein